jgi:hypothetical protein
VIEIVPFASQHVEGVGALIIGIQRDEFQIPITLEDQPDLHNIPAFCTTEKFLAAHRFYERNGFQQMAASELPPSFPRWRWTPGSTGARSRRRPSLILFSLGA